MKRYFFLTLFVTACTTEALQAQSGASETADCSSYSLNLNAHPFGLAGPKIVPPAQHVQPFMNAFNNLRSHYMGDYETGLGLSAYYDGPPVEFKTREEIEEVVSTEFGVGAVATSSASGELCSTLLFSTDGAHACQNELKFPTAKTCGWQGILASEFELCFDEDIYGYEKLKAVQTGNAETLKWTIHSISDGKLEIAKLHPIIDRSSVAAEVYWGEEDTKIDSHRFPTQVSFKGIGGASADSRLTDKKGETVEWASQVCGLGRAQRDAVARLLMLQDLVDYAHSRDIYYPRNK